MRTFHLQIIIILLTIVFTCITFVPIVARSIHTDSSRVDIYFQGYNQDYMQFLAGIVRGQHGFFWYHDFFDVPHPKPMPVYLLYPIIGFITAPFGIWAPFAYHGARVLLIFFSVWALYQLSVTLLKSKRWGSVATLISMLVTNPPSFLYSSLIAHSFKSWWNDLLANERLNGPAHYLAARGLLCLAILEYLKYRSGKTKRFLIFASIAATLCVFMVPQTVVPFILIIGIGTLWDGIILLKAKKTIKSALSPILTLIMPVISLVVIQLSTQTHVWIAVRQWEVQYFGLDPWTNYHLYISYLFILIPAYAGFALWARQKDIRGYFMLGWALVPLLFTPLTPIIGLGGLRFDYFIYIFIPLSILSTVALRKALTIRTWKIVSITYIVLVLLWTSVSVASAVKQQWDPVFREGLGTRYYPPKEYFELVHWVQTNVRYEQVILASDEIGTLLVSQWPVFGYIGDLTHGSNWDVNTWALQRFYSEQMTTTEALSWLKAHDVSYVVDDPKYIWPLKDLTYPFLIKRWQNSQLGIYEVRYNTKVTQ